MIADAELKFLHPKPKQPLTLLISTQLLLNSHHPCQMRLRRNSLKKYFLKYSFCSLFQSKKIDRHKKDRSVSSGGWSFQSLDSKTRLKNLDQLLLNYK